MLHVESGGAFQLSADREHFAIPNLMKTDNYVSKASLRCIHRTYDENTISITEERMSKVDVQVVLLRSS
ncbi:MAG: hypothetical protein OM95_04955 [Bdellovibrio sp. ArHS]|uniref:hypothetical protein n=1 Tax=Bdellovibrio sp. ArHS TaxID=1569284 RepID=UPI0005830BAC|nr:hypothetical protein [Bdellovibrio sp. ArHS]KHD89170.1 MAG: hypothetical protein OM95_04955 [Bdellovibrio sp. ArHS]